MSAVLIVCRVILAVLFAVSGAAKLLDRSGTSTAVMHFGVPTRLIAPISWALPAVELAIAPSMLARASAWWGAIAAVVLLAAFQVAIGRLVRRGEAPECHCFGQIRSSRVGKGTLVRNTAFMVPAVFLVARGPSGVGPSVVDAFDRERPGELVLTGAVIALALALGVLAWSFRRLRLQQAELRSSVELVERLFDELESRRPEERVAAAAAPRPGLPIGVGAPAVTLASVDGTEMPVEVPARRSTLVVFASAHCGPCRELLLALDKRADDTGVGISVVLPGSPDDNERLVRDFPRLRLLFDGGTHASSWFRVNLTPGAVLIGEGRVLSPPAYGVAAITGLLERADDTDGPVLPADSLVGTTPPAHPELLVHDARPVAAVLWRDSCPHCAAMVADIEAWVARSEDRPRLVVITGDDGPLVNDFGAGRVLDTAGVMASELRLPGTPSAVLIGPDGRIASDPCIGAEDIRLLLGMERAPRPTPVELSQK